MADDDDRIQVTTPLLQSFLAPVPRERMVTRIKNLAGVSQVARSLHELYGLPPSPDASTGTWPAAAVTTAETHELLTPLTAATVSALHAVEADLMIRAMIEAAKSDGKIDPEERRRILTCLKDAGTTESDHAALLAAMSGPPDLDGLVARVTSPELAVEVYAASLLAIKDDQPSEQHYLARLGQRLKLAPETIAAMHVEYGDPPPLPPE
jgi:uncharacterized membrane protein YebE (DUF533 family)